MKSNRLMVSDIEDGDIIIPDSKCYFLVKKSSVKVGKTGKKYIDLDLFDGVSTVAGKVWDITEETAEAVQAGNVIQVLTGKTGKYLSNMQITINDAVIVPPEKIDSECAGILPESFYTCEELGKQWDELCEVLVPKHREIVNKFMENEKIWHLFTTIPGGRSMHHACRRGLWEHSISVAQSALAVSDVFDEKYGVNISLVVLSSMLHDIGKIFEFQINPATSMVDRYSDRGKLLGHIYMGATWLEKLVSSCFPDDSDLKMDLIHVILSHHGQYEFGSPKRPKTLEALIVSACDNLDASCDAVKSCFGDNMDGNWTKPVYMMDRAFFRRQENADDGKNESYEESAE
ncbi:HD domain-containing protein [bacterium]|nr:HD domain-containing protein [bacterium]